MEAKIWEMGEDVGAGVCGNGRDWGGTKREAEWVWVHESVVCGWWRCHRAATGVRHSATRGLRSKARRCRAGLRWGGHGGTRRRHEERGNSAEGRGGEGRRRTQG